MPVICRFPTGIPVDVELSETSGNPVSSKAVAAAIKSLEATKGGMTNSTTEFNADGSITETTDNYIKNTVFNDDGSITEVINFTNGTTITKTTSFNEDGTITEVFE